MFRGRIALLALLTFALGGALVCCNSGGGGSAPSPVAAASPTPAPFTGPPNFVLIVADDAGYGDLSSFGSTQIKTPNLDRMATEGVKLTGFTVPVSECAPSRAALMTGRYPIRVGIPWNPPVRLNDKELTVADLLKTRGYATAIVGKWHLGWVSADMPIHHGFDYFYGMPAGDDGGDMWLGDQPTTDSVGMDLLAQRYTDYAIKWMQSVKGRPFLLYLPYRSPHVPLYASAPFLGRSAGGLYGDVIEEMDANIGRLLKELQDEGIDRQTLVVFMSDNGPSRVKGAVFGSAGPFSGGKGSCLEGGLRQPGIAYWPGRIPGGRSITDNTSSLDLLPTFLALAGGALPADRAYYGLDITRLLTGDVARLPGPGFDGGRELIHYWSTAPSAIRTGHYKYLAPGFWGTDPALYDLDTDPAENFDLRASHPDIAVGLKERLDEIADQVVRNP